MRQLFIRADLNYAFLPHHYDAVCISQGGQAVRNRHDCKRPFFPA
jgi:hypothetical protein